MARELAISLYLFVFKCVFSFFNRMPLKDKTTFVISFGDNSQYVFKEMQEKNIKTEIIFLCKGKSIIKFKDYQGVKKIPFETFSILNWFKSVYHLATSRYILVDNYYGFLASTRFRAGVECIQLWHASGAMKKFGLEDKSIKNRSKKANQRFLLVYNRFHKVVVGSDVMAETFKKSFNLEEENILRTGIPRTDFFFNEKEKQKVLDFLTVKHPGLAGKKIILYAPTYRDFQIDDFSLKLDIEKMHQELGDEYKLILRLHPAIQNLQDLMAVTSNFVYNFSSDKYEINDLLVIADILITDYSSIPFDYSLLHRPIIFFTYDLEEYKEMRGVIDGFEDNLPGPIVKDTDTIIELIKQGSFDLTKIDYYAEYWNKYSRGNSSSNLVNYLYVSKGFKEYDKITEYN
ncbi:CDP-glycerol glycerophosphotransferase family protein [Neobacillus mesonae]|uniref:CDP-glycerol glycerophosphotransferase family protein n=1 Tax=Neobacillus mesonae TaxID=1193713 RepID=UPI0020420108|nr:CDP-glycerol glycerophosphotransferase family protein [Neobacillus mesonae]MCM3567391.1 CDP-glycerol glycerophosphotransferase family protein [Neobacillus mesonae]